MLQFVRISSADPSGVVISRVGKHPNLLVQPMTDVEMTDVQAKASTPSLLAEPPSRFSSTMMTMDDPCSSAFQAFLFLVEPTIDFNGYHRAAVPLCVYDQAFARCERYHRSCLPSIGGIQCRGFLFFKTTDAWA